jgi:cell division septal protein FtsQ
LSPPTDVTARPAHLRGPEIDPRIRARRIEVRRSEGRQRLRRLLLVGLVLLVALGFGVALRSPLLDVAEVRVAGAEHTAVDAVAEAAGIDVGDQLMDLDLGAAAARVGALPWVGEVRIHRSLGGGVDIAVTEREPAAVVGEGEAAVLVDERGRILARVTDQPDLASGLVRVAGLTTERVPGQSLPRETLDALALAQRLGAAVPGAIASVRVGEELTATLAQGGEVRFGDTARLTAKLRSLETVLDQVDLTCLAMLDLTAPTSPVLTRREGCS